MHTDRFVKLKKVTDQMD